MAIQLRDELAKLQSNLANQLNKRGVSERTASQLARDVSNVGSAILNPEIQLAVVELLNFAKDLSEKDPDQFKITTNSDWILPENKKQH